MHQRDPPAIEYLGDHAHAVPDLAEALLAHYREVLPDDTLERRVARLQEHCSRDSLPIAWVAVDREEVLGTAALRVHDLHGREDLSPWLGGVFVMPQHRRRGVGAALCAEVERQALIRGVTDLYLFTLDRQSWYASLGWSHYEACSWQGRSGDIMRKDLGGT